MFTSVPKKYCKEQSLRYASREPPPLSRLGLHKSSLGRESFGPVERKSGSFKNGLFGRCSDFRKEHKSKETSTHVGSGLFDRSGLQEPLKYWGEVDKCGEDKYSSSEPLKNSLFRSTGKGYSAATPSSNINTSSREQQQKGYGNQLLSLRAELSEKELQLVEIQQQHNKLICRSTDAFKKLEVAIKTKDQVIWQLHQALQSKQDDLERHEKLFDEEKQVLLQTTQQQKHSEIEHKDAEIALLRTKTSSQAHELQQREEIISSMKQQLHEEKEKNVASPAPQFLYTKMDSLMGQVQSLESCLHTKETELESQKQLINDLKTLVWKRECMLGQLQVTEQQLQTALARQTEAYNALEAQKSKLEEERGQMEKSLASFQKELEILGSAAMNDRQLKEDLKAQEVCLQNKERQIHELQRALHAKDAALTVQSKKFQLQLEENQKLIEECEMLKQEYAALRQENLDELVASKLFQESCKVEYTADQEILEIPVEDEPCVQEIIRPPKPLTPKRDTKSLESLQALQPPQPKSPPDRNKSISAPGCDNELLTIEAEIGRREKEWRQTEAKMRAELCRRIAQLNELENFRPPPPKPEQPSRPDSVRSQYTTGHIHRKHNPF